MWGIPVLFALGALYAYVVPGREDKLRLWGVGFAIGAVLSVVIVLVAIHFNVGPVGTVQNTIADVAIATILLTASFVAGAIVGDWFERHRRRRKTR
jgi:Kef-type K+ transport system membrane component KefB